MPQGAVRSFAKNSIMSVSDNEIFSYLSISGQYIGSKLSFNLMSWTADLSSRLSSILNHI